MNYIGDVYRPPSEARSYILQATVGCSHNNCRFCYMYKKDKFFIKDKDLILKEIKKTAKINPYIDRVFIADGDALIMPTDDLIDILDELYSSFNNLQRVGVYASPKSIHKKSPKELTNLKAKGLTIAYIGLESGSDKVLDLMDKGDSKSGIIKASKKLQSSGIDISVTAISGLGGKQFSLEHAKETADAINKIKPKYFALLTLMIDKSTPLYQDYIEGEFITLSSKEILQETRLLLENLNDIDTEFRSNHASNYISLKGNLKYDRETLIKKIRDSDSSCIKNEWMRRL